MKSWHRVAQWGCLSLILLSACAIGGWIMRIAYSTRREPELAIRSFVRKQLAAFPPGWYVDESHMTLWTSTRDPHAKFTNASWMVAVDFWYRGNTRLTKGIAVAHEQIFVYKSPLDARSTAYPSEYWATYWEGWITSGRGNIPSGWRDRPPHADRFELKCWGNDPITKPELCSLILVYEEYFIILDTPIGDYMTLNDLRRIVDLIDREMTDHLNHSILRLGPREMPTDIP